MHTLKHEPISCGGTIPPSHSIHFPKAEKLGVSALKKFLVPIAFSSRFFEVWVIPQLMITTGSTLAVTITGCTMNQSLGPLLQDYNTFPS